MPQPPRSKDDQPSKVKQMAQPSGHLGDQSSKHRDGQDELPPCIGFEEEYVRGYKSPQEDDTMARKKTSKYLGTVFCSEAFTNPCKSSVLFLGWNRSSIALNFGSVRSPSQGIKELRGPVHAEEQCMSTLRVVRKRRPRIFKTAFEELIPVAPPRTVHRHRHLRKFRSPQLQLPLCIARQPLRDRVVSFTPPQLTLLRNNDRPPAFDAMAVTAHLRISSFLSPAPQSRLSTVQSM